MKKQSKIIISILSLILLTLIIILVVLIISNSSNNKNISETNKNSNIEKIEDKSTDHTSKTEKAQEEEPPPTSEEKLYITYGDKTVVAYKGKQDFKNNPEDPNEVKKNFDKLWNEIDCDVLTFNQRDIVDATLQLSRYGYPKDDIVFYIEERIFFYDTGTNGKTSYGYFYTKDEPNSKILRISDGNIGRNIQGFKIKGTWYIYKVIVTE